jgi:hypothetical protein
MNDSLKRCPRNYYGKEFPHKNIRSILPKIVDKIEKKACSKDKVIVDFWPKIVGEKLARLTKATSFEEGVLHVIVKSNTLYSLLVQHERKKLIKLYQEKFPHAFIKNIYFKMG